MPRQYCQRCAAEVPVEDGVCFFGHEVGAEVADAPPATASDDTEAAGTTPLGPRMGAPDDVDEDLFAARPDQSDEAETPEPPTGTEPDVAGEADDGVDVAALEEAIAELESRELEEDGEPTDGIPREIADPDEPAAAAPTGEPDAAPTDEPEIDDLIADGDFESGLTWEGEVETEPEDATAPAGAADDSGEDRDGVDAGETAWTAEEDEADAFADWDLDDWEDETGEAGPAETAAAASAVDELAAPDDLAPEDDVDRGGEREGSAAAPPRSHADDRAAALAGDADADDDGHDEPGPAIDPTSFTARDRKRKGLLSRLFG